MDREHVAAIMAAILHAAPRAGRADVQRFREEAVSAALDAECAERNRAMK